MTLWWPYNDLQTNEEIFASDGQVEEILAINQTADKLPKETNSKERIDAIISQVDFTVISTLILKKKSKSRDRHPTLARFASICTYFCALDFCSEITVGHGPKNGKYICSARHISLMSAYAIWNKHYKKAVLTLYLNI